MQILLLKEPTRLASYSIGLRGSQSSVHMSLLGCVALVVGLHVILVSAAQHPRRAVKGLGAFDAVFQSRLRVFPVDWVWCNALDDAGVRFRVANWLPGWAVAVVEALNALVFIGANRGRRLAEALLLTVYAIAAVRIVVNADEESIVPDLAARSKGAGEVFGVAFRCAVSKGTVLRQVAAATKATLVVEGAGAAPVDLNDALPILEVADLILRLAAGGLHAAFAAAAQGFAEVALADISRGADDGLVVNLATRNTAAIGSADISAYALAAATFSVVAARCAEEARGTVEIFRFTI
jgi:hypothetical protein